MLYRELKSATGAASTAQTTWLDALTDAGADACLWRPDDLLSGRVARELAAIASITTRRPVIERK